MTEFTDMIALKVGADTVLISSEKAARKHAYVKEATVKKQSFVVSFDRV